MDITFLLLGGIMAGAMSFLYGWRAGLVVFVGLLALYGFARIF